MGAASEVARCVRKKKRRIKPISVRELYALIVGEAGVSPDYFMRDMTCDEAADFVIGFDRRQRGAWERARIGWYILCAGGEIQSPQDIYSFPWDKQPKSVSVKEINRLRKKAKEYEKTMNNGK